MSTHSHSERTNDLRPGTFEYIEARIRREADGTQFGGDFESLCHWFLQHSPRFRGMHFKNVWLWNDWPGRWGPDAGIDIVAQDQNGDLWAVQAKAYSPESSITKSDIDSFLSESNRPQIAFRLLIATTDRVGSRARQVIDGQEKQVGQILRGDLISEQITWPTSIDKPAKPSERWKPRTHQKHAIKAVKRGFEQHDRGRLIMACGSGKTLTALWIAETLKSQRTLVLVPSLSLVAQNLAEWGRHATHDFDALVVCSDESVADRRRDVSMQSVQDLGVKVTTDSGQIRRFLGKRRNRCAVVFATYQSSDRIAEAQYSPARAFDFAICDEAHRLAGRSGSSFATVLDAAKIKAKKRLFMTATPRYITDHVKRRAAELDCEVVSMDDEDVFGPEFHVLSF